MLSELLNMKDWLSLVLDESSYVYALLAFIVLGIERILYGYMYIFTPHFKESVRKGLFGSRIQAEPLYWKCAMMLGTYIKVFQFSIIVYDLVFRCSLATLFAFSSTTISDKCVSFLGVCIFGMGQFLNYAVFQALTGMGVYFGYEFGYPVKRVTCFPYNTKISDPQYWGVVISIWGVYLALGSSSLLIPMLETIWYLASMKFLEHPRGRRLVNEIIKKRS